MREEYVVATKVHGRTMPGENGRGLSRKRMAAYAWRYRYAATRRKTVSA